MRRQRTSRDPIGDQAIRAVSQRHLADMMHALASSRYTFTDPSAPGQNETKLITMLLNLVEDEATGRIDPQVSVFTERMAADFRQLVVEAGLWSAFYDSEPSGKRCAVCWRLLDASTRGRPRVYCGRRECRNKARSARMRRQREVVMAERADEVRQALAAVLRLKLDAPDALDTDQDHSRGTDGAAV